MAFGSLPDRYQSQLSSVTGEDYVAFNGPYTGSKKIADFAVKFLDNTGRLNYKLVLEVGFAESYEHLIQSVKLWLEGTSSVFVCLCISILEDPKYQNPLKNLSEAELEVLQLSEENIGQCPDFVLPANSYGPATFLGFDWTGQLRSARLEVWKKNAYGKAELQEPTWVVPLFFFIWLTALTAFSRKFSQPIRL